MSDDGGHRPGSGESRRHRPRLARGTRDFIGGNCTVSLMLMAMTGLFRAGLVEWVSAMTYQAASGAGRAAHARTGRPDGRRVCLRQGSARRTRPARSISIDRTMAETLRERRVPDDAVRSSAGRQPAAVDRQGPRQRAEPRGVEGAWPSATRSSAGTAQPIPVDGICVRIGAMRCHSQALTVKLTRDVPLAEIERLIAAAHEWVRVVPNEKEATLAALTPAAVTGTLERAGRAPAEAGDGAGVSRQPSPSATSCCGARRSRCAACSGFWSKSIR